VTLSPGVPYRATEAGETALQQVRAAFDSEVLTRVEAFEEAKLDFTIADADRNGQMTADEFANLVDSWRANEARQAPAPSEEFARQRQFEALLESVDPESAEAQNQAYAKAKFAFISGASETISREDYIREYLLDFDTMDGDGDTLLQGEELLRFRAANRGETIEM
jgi:Ca2+-binding EF-hand superfamily protein